MPSEEGAASLEGEHEKLEDERSEVEVELAMASQQLANLHLEIAEDQEGARVIGAPRGANGPARRRNLPYNNH